MDAQIRRRWQTAASCPQDPEAQRLWLHEMVRNDCPCDICKGAETGRRHECADTGRYWLPRIRLAALCGHEAAQQACGTDLTWTFGHQFENGNWLPIAGRMPLSDFVSVLAQWGEAIQFRAALAAARTAEEVWAAGLPWSDEDSGGWADDQSEIVREALDLGERWLNTPSVTLAEACRHLVLRAGLDWLPAPGLNHVQTTIAAARVSCFDTVRAAISAALIKWALA